MSNKSTRSRSEVVEECVNQVIGCWNYYSNEPLKEVHRQTLLRVLRNNLPVTIDTFEWEKLAKEWDKERNELHQKEGTNQ